MSDAGRSMMSKEHTTQWLSLAAFFLVAIIGGVWWLSVDIADARMDTAQLAAKLSSEIASIQINDNEAIYKQAGTTEEMNAAMGQRVTTLETETSAQAKAINNLSLSYDQLRTAIGDLTNAVTKLTASQDRHR